MSKSRICYGGSLSPALASVWPSCRVTSDALSQSLANELNVKAYDDSPRITLLTTGYEFDANGQPTLAFEADLRKDEVRVVVAPGQNSSAAVTFRMSHGLLDTGVETALAGAATGGTATVVRRSDDRHLAQNAGIPFVTLYSGNRALLDTLNISADAKVLIGQALDQGNMVIVPTQAVEIDGVMRIGWYETNLQTGDTIGVLDDGSHGLTTSFHRGYFSMAGESRSARRAAESLDHHGVRTSQGL